MSWKLASPSVYFSLLSFLLQMTRLTVAAAWFQKKLTDWGSKRRESLHQLLEAPAMICSAISCNWSTKTVCSQSLKTRHFGLSLHISCSKGLSAARASGQAKVGTTWLLLAEHNRARTLLQGNLERYLAGRGRTGFKRLCLQLPLGTRTPAASKPAWLVICENKHQNAWAGRKYVPD